MAAGSGDAAAQQRLGQAVRQLRTERKLSRRDLERATGLSYPYLSEIEAGKKSPSSRTLRTIAEALGMEAHEVLARAEAADDPWLWEARSTSPDPLAPSSAQGAPSPTRLFLKQLVSEPTPEMNLEGRRGSVSESFSYESDEWFSQPGRGLSPEEARKQLALLARDLSPGDLALLIWLATRLRR